MPLSATAHTNASGLGLLFGGVGVVAACGYQARRSNSPRRTRAWILFGVGAVSGTVGNMTLWRGTSGMSPTVEFLLTTVSLMLALLLGIVATITFPATPRRPAEIARIVMDGVIIGGSLLFFASVTLFPRVVAVDGDPVARAVLLAVPVIDVVVATTAFLLYLGRNPADGPFLGLVSLGFVLFSVSDFYTAIASPGGVPTFGSPLDIGWIAGYCVIAWGVFSAFPHSSTDSSHPESSFVLGTALMFAIFVAAALTNLREDQLGQLSPTSAVLWLMVLLAVVGRQISLVIDNQRMHRVLSRRVDSVTQQAELMFSSVADGIYGVNQAGVVTLVNPIAAQLLGYPPSALIGRIAHESFHVPLAGQPSPEDACYITQAIDEGIVTTARDDNYRRADGRVIPVEVTASPTTEQGEPRGAVVVFRDVTQRREIDRLKGEFVSIVSHELRTPLTSIHGSLALLAGGALGEQSPAAQRMTKVALDSSLRLGRLINDILEVEQIHSGVLSMDVQRHDARTLVLDAVAQVELLAGRAGITLVVGELPGVVAADGDRILQTLINLLENAIKFSEPGSAVTVHTEAVGTFVQFVITDAGRGIPEGQLEAVFTRFVQVDSSDSRDHGGTGLGLAVCRSIVERLGGRIWAENNTHGGATLRFTLPVAASDEQLRRSAD